MTELASRHGVDALTADGRIVRIRPTTAADAPGLQALYAGGSPDSLYRRFFTGGRPNVDEEVARLTRPDSPDHAGLLAEQAGQIIAVASWERLGETSEAEFAVFVADAHHGRGIGTLLLEYLAAAARQVGVTELMGEVLPGNAPMVRVAADLGSGLRLTHEEGLVVVRMPTDGADTTALDARDRHAARLSLTPLLAPRSVAVIGAGRQPGGVGHAVLTNLVAGGFTGTVYPVNPQATTIAGVTAYPSIAAVPEPVDLVVIAVPAPAVATVLDECGAHGVRAAVVLTAGFGEEGEAGRTAQAELVHIARRHGLRMVGPNCLGVLNTDPQVRLQATFATVDPQPGGLAVASQSGAVAISILEHARRAGTGLSSFVSLGNKADVSGNDLLSYWYDDPATTAVALYLESVGNPRRFAHVARALARRKPVLAVKSGRSAAGQRAGASHTAAAAAPDATVAALFAQAGVVRCDTLGELFDAARLFVAQPLPAGSRLGVVGNAGGVNVMVVDAADAYRLSVPTLAAPMQERIAAGAPKAATVANPIDLGAAATPETFTATIHELATSGTVDALLVVFAVTGANDVPGTVAAISAAVDESAIPVAAVLLGVPDAPTSLGSRHAPVYDLPEQAVVALGHAAGYARWRATPTGRRPDFTDVDRAAARAIVAGALATGGGWQPADVAASLLRCYGIPVLPGAVVAGVDAALDAAAEFGYPVALKAADPALVHKSDLGAVQLGLSTADEVRDAYVRIAAAVSGSAPVLVQPMAAPGVELVAGVVHDGVFGSLVMIGLGGVHTEIFADRALRLLPVTDVDAAAMWRSLRAAPLLTGYRGQPPVDTAAVEELELRLGRLAEDLPEIAELDLNPVIAGTSGVVAVDVKLRLAAIGDEPDAAVRALREPR